MDHGEDLREASCRDTLFPDPVIFETSKVLLMFSIVWFLTRHMFLFLLWHVRSFSTALVTHHWWNWQDSDSQSVFPRPAAASPRNWFEMQILRDHPRTCELETVWCKATYCFLTTAPPPPRVILMHAKVWEECAGEVLVTTHLTKWCKLTYLLITWRSNLQKPCQE